MYTDDTDPIKSKKKFCKIYIFAQLTASLGLPSNVFIRN